MTTVAAPGLDQLCTVYTRDGTTGRYTTALLTDVQCRLTQGSMNDTVVAGPDRRELAGIRILLWDPAIVIPENVQIAVDDIFGPDGVTLARWNVEAGSLSISRGPRGVAIFRRATVVRAT